MNSLILHIDMNSYFASVEQQANPFLRGKPIAVAGKAGATERSVVTTASIEAKRLGVKTAMSTWEAKRMCPSLLFVAGDPEKYSEITHRFNRIYGRYTDRVEPFSVDESFLDITKQADDLLGAVGIALRIRDDLRRECGERITASIGIAPNRVIAKAASEQVKPDGLTVVRPQDMLSFLDSIDLQDLCGIGSRTAKRLDALGITSMRQLREYPVACLVHEFKKYGYWLHAVAHGEDPSEVVNDALTATTPTPPSKGGASGDQKSYGHSYTLPKDTWDLGEIRSYLLGLADKVAWRLRRDGWSAGLVHASVRYGNFKSDSQQARLTVPTNDGMKLFETAWSLMNHWENIRALKTIRRDPGDEAPQAVRLVGISAGMLSSARRSSSLFAADQKVSSALSALDRLQHRYGSRAWTRASLLPIRFRARSSGFHYDHEI